MMFIGRLLLFIAFTASYAGLLSVEVVAMEGFAQYLQVEGSRPVQAGDLVSYSDDKYYLSKEDYDHKVVGVVTESPTVVYGVRENGVPVATQGLMTVNVSSKQGNIEAGDYITTSQTEGIGMKATKPGVVVGKALEDFSADSVEEIGQIKVAMNIHYGSVFGKNTSLLDATYTQVKAALAAGLQEALSRPNAVIRYIVSAIVFLASVIFGFWLFGRTVGNGITAVARNPLAKRSIVITVFLNIILTFIFVFAGLALSIFLLGL